MKWFSDVFLSLLVLSSGACASSGDAADSDPEVEGTFRLHSFFQDGMVIQRNQPFRLWGKATAGVRIRVKPSWSAQEYDVQVPETGSWMVEFPVPEAPSDNAPQSIVVSTTIQTLLLRDLLIGEVWLLSGQSNMAFTLNQVRDAASEVAAADFPFVRFFTVAESHAADPLYDWTDPMEEPFGHWYTTTPATAGTQSAVGYYFGRMLYETLKVPIGLVNTSRGGATAQAYTALGDLERDPVLKETFVDPYRLDPAMDVLVRPSEIYNSMVYPLQRLSIRGVAWYQGEGNWDTYPVYPLLMKTLIESWRRDFDCGEIPFYYVQIAPYGFPPNDTSSLDWFYTQGPMIGYAYMREAQSLTRDQVSNTGMAVTMDVGDPDDIHPTNKRPVGERLARLALYQTYGYADVVCCGPRYRSMSVENGIIKLAFDHAEGLKTNDGGAPRYFYVASTAGTHHRFYPAEAEIQGSEVWLRCPEIVTDATEAEDLAVRYAFLLYPVTNLENGEGLPAEPFRTDDWTTDISYVY